MVAASSRTRPQSIDRRYLDIISAGEAAEIVTARGRPCTHWPVAITAL